MAMSLLILIMLRSFNLKKCYNDKGKLDFQSITDANFYTTVVMTIIILKFLTICHDNIFKSYYWI